MADLIERDEALRVVGEFDDREIALWEVNRITDGCKEALAALPDVGAVKVVRRKDCKHWNKGECYRLELSRPNDFCSYGEEKL